MDVTCSGSGLILMVEPPAVRTEVGAKTNSAAPLHQEARNTSSCSVPNPPPTCGVCGMLPQLDVRSASWVVPERPVPKTARPDRPNRTNPSTYPSARSFVADSHPQKYFKFKTVRGCSDKSHENRGEAESNCLQRLNQTSSQKARTCNANTADPIGLRSAITGTGRHLGTVRAVQEDAERAT